MPTKLFKNIVLPKTYEESREFYEHFNFKRRLGNAHYHTPIDLETVTRHYIDIPAAYWNFKPVVLLCPCTFEYTDLIDVENWTAESSIACSACGRIFKEKTLKIYDEIKAKKKARSQMIHLQSSNGHGLNELSGDTMLYLSNNSNNNLINTLKADLTDPLFIPAFSHGELSNPTYRNSLISISDLKNNDHIVSMTILVVTLDLVQTSKTSQKYIHKLSIDRTTLAFNKEDQLFRKSFYNSGRYSQKLIKNSEAITNTIPVMKNRAQSGVIGLSAKDSLDIIFKFFNDLLKTSSLRGNPAYFLENITDSGITRITEGLHLIESFMEALNTPVSANQVIETLDSSVLIEYMDKVQYALLQKICEPYQANLDLLNDAIGYNILILALKNMKDLKNNQKQIFPFLFELIKGDTYTSIRALLRYKLNLSKKGVKSFIEFLKSAVEHYNQYGHVLLTHTSMITLTHITDPGVSYAFLRSANESDAYKNDNPFQFGNHWAGNSIRIYQNSFLYTPMGRNYKVAAQNLVNKVILRVVLATPDTNDDVYAVEDLFRELTTVSNRIYGLPKDIRKPILNEFIKFLETQSVKSIHLCEQAFLRFQTQLAANHKAYAELVKSEHLNLNQSKADHKTYERQEGETSFTIPEHGFDMYILGETLDICVGGRYYQQAVAKNRTQIVVASRENKKVVIEIEKDPKGESNGTIVQAKTRFNERSQAFKEMLDDIYAYINHLKLAVRTYDLPRQSDHVIESHYI